MGNSYMERIVGAGCFVADTADQWTSDCKMLVIGQFGYNLSGDCYENRKEIESEHGPITDAQWKECRNDRTSRFLTHVEETQVPQKIAQLEQKAIDAIHERNELSLSEEEQEQRKAARKVIRDRTEYQSKVSASIAAGKMSPEAGKVAMETYDLIHDTDASDS